MDIPTYLAPLEVNEVRPELTDEQKVKLKEILKSGRLNAHLLSLSGAKRAKRYAAFIVIPGDRLD